jgi:hypothetical protein
MACSPSTSTHAKHNAKLCSELNYHTRHLPVRLPAALVEAHSELYAVAVSSSSSSCTAPQSDIGSWPLTCSFSTLVFTLLTVSSFLCPVSWDPPLSHHSIFFEVCLTGISPPNVLYSIFLFMRFPSVHSLRPAYCNRLRLTPTDIHGLSRNLCCSLLHISYSPSVIFFYCSPYSFQYCSVRSIHSHSRF